MMTSDEKAHILHFFFGHDLNFYVEYEFPQHPLSKGHPTRLISSRLASRGFFTSLTSLFGTAITEQQF